MNLRLATVLAALFALPIVARPAERIVSIDGGKAPLFGTLEAPDAGPRSGPAVLILPGSGPTDRNGNSTLGPAPNELGQLADHLAAAGVQSLRIDKRGIGASAPAAPPERDLRLTSYVDDAVAWTAWLRGQPGVRCVVIAGHSEGAIIAFLAAQKTDVCGVISLEGPGRPLGEVLRDQLRRRLSEPLRSQALAVLDQLVLGHAVADPSAELAALFRPSVQPYLISELMIDPAAEARKVRAPMLFVQGDADQQVTSEDFDRLKAARPDGQVLLIAGMIHPLKTSPAPGEAVRLTSLPLAKGLGEAVVAFIASLGVGAAEPVPGR
jgi:alpha-beta hydrolase superfamily lysophospholipase